MRRKMTLAGLTAALFLLSVGGSFAQDRPARTGARGMGARMAESLDLTPDQQAKFDEIRKARQEEATAFREEMGKLRPQLREAMKDPQADQKKIDDLIDQLTRTRAAHLKSLVRGRKDLEKVLSPEQLEKFRRARSRMGMRRGFDRGFGPRRWMRPGRGPRPFGGFGWDEGGWF